MRPMIRQLVNTKRFSLIFLFLLLTNLASVEASTQIQFAEAFNIKAVNGVSYPSGLVAQNKLIKLRAGLNLIAIEFEEIYESEDNDNFDIVKSNVFLLKIYLQKNTEYQQRFTKPHDASAAKRYVLNPIFEILELAQLSNNKTVSPVRFELTPLASNETSYLIAQTKLRPNATLNLSHSNSNSQTKSLKMPLTHRQNPLLGQSNATKMLEYWWQQATPEERQAFLESVSTK